MASSAAEIAAYAGGKRGGAATPAVGELKEVGAKRVHLQDPVNSRAMGRQLNLYFRRRRQILAIEQVARHVRARR